MSYNLTPKQRDDLKWVVEQIQAGHLEESFIITWGSPSIITDGWIGSRTGVETDRDRSFILGTIEAWDRVGLVNVKTPEPKWTQAMPLSWMGTYYSRCTMTQSAYDAVESDFMPPEPPPNSKRLLSLLKLGFGRDELQAIAFIIGADPDSIAGGTTEKYALDLIAYAKRRDLLWKLVHTALTRD